MWKRTDRACGRTARILGEYLDGALPLRQRRAVEAHVDACAACRREMEAARGTLALLAGLPRRELSSAFDTALRERLAAAASTPPQRPRFWPGARTAEARWLRAPWPSPYRRLAPAAALAVASLGLFFLKAPPAPPPNARPVPAYVKAMVHEHQMLNTGADLNATVVGHNLNGDLLGDGDEE